MSDSESAAPAARSPAGRTRLFAAVAGVLVLLLVGGTAVVVVSRDGETAGIADGPLLKARAGVDAVPSGRIIEEVPRNCGVSEATAARLAPGSDPDAEKGGAFREGGPGSCRWYSLDDGEVTCDFCRGDFENERVLNVDIRLAAGRRRSPITQAMLWLHTGGPEPDVRLGSPKIVEGLGDEAVAYYSAAADMEGASVTFRVGNALATVRYRGWNDVGDRRATIPEEVALDGAFAAAAETAKSLGGEARPVVGAVERPVTPPLRKIPKPCDAVPAATVERVARGAYRRRGSPILLIERTAPGMSFDTCVWTAGTSRYANRGRERVLTVTLATAEARVPGSGVSTAKSLYLGHYRNHRSGKVPGNGAYTGFMPLAGPGDRAFAVTKGRSGPSGGDVGLVVFQQRNVLVEVAYQGRDGETELRGSRLVDSAYTVAVAVERTLRS